MYKTCLDSPRTYHKMCNVLIEKLKPLAAILESFRRRQEAGKVCLFFLMNDAQLLDRLLQLIIPEHERRMRESACVRLSCKLQSCCDSVVAYRGHSR